MDNENNTSVLTTAQTIAAYATAIAAITSAVYITVALGRDVVEIVKDQRAHRRTLKKIASESN